MSSQHKKQGRGTVLVVWSLVAAILCSSVLAACGGSPASVSSQTYQYKPFLALIVQLDNTTSFPVQFQQEAARNLADRISSYISPNMGGMFVDVGLIEVNSLQNSYVSFSTPAIPTIPPKPQPGNDPYTYAKALKNWKQTVASVNALVASVRASIKPSLDKLYSLHLQEVGGTDIPGSAGSAADEFAHFPNGTKVLLYVSDMQSNVAVNFSKHINLHGAKVVVTYHVCQVESACEQNDAFWTQQFKEWGAASVKFYSPAESEAEHITGF